MSLDKLLPEIHNQRVVAAAARLKLVVHGSGWQSVVAMRHAFANVAPLKAFWADQRYASYKSPPKFETESTYQDCVKWEYRPAEETLRVDFWNGDFHGRPEKLRCTWVYRVIDTDPVFSTALAAATEQRLWQVAAAEEKAEFEAAREKRREELFNGFLSTPREQA